MTFLDKIKAQSKIAAAYIKAEYLSIESPAVRLAILIAAFVIAIIVALKALPLLILIALAVGSYLCVKAIMSEDKDSL